MSVLWRKIPVTKGDIDLRILLTCGQSFTWNETNPNIWTNVIENVVFSLSQTDSEILWSTPLRDQIMGPYTKANVFQENLSFVDKPSNDVRDNLMEANTTGQQVIQTKRRSRKVVDQSSESPRNGFSGNSHTKSQDAILDDKVPDVDFSKDDGYYEEILRDYFQLDVDLPSLYKRWSSADKNFQQISDSFPGIRIMRQDPTENLFAFICSANNHVSRISSMVNKLSRHYGNKLGCVEGFEFFSFPAVEKLTQSTVETHLRELGFGYRAKYIATTAKMLHNERPHGWLKTLRERPYDECISELTKLQGVGRKVADCVALMSLDKAHVVPVDTHVLQIAVRDYHIPGVTKETKSLTPALHDKIGKYFIDLYGEYAGWAHTVLFAADLKRFSDHKPLKKKSAKKVTPPAKTGVDSLPKQDVEMKPNIRKSRKRKK